MKPDTPPPAHPAYRPDIDGLRAIAILSVLGFHAFPAWVPGGFIGVDIFFVISGYLISGILLSNLRAGHFSIRDFYARRIRRIFPALILVLFAVLAFGFVVAWPGEYYHIARHAAGGVGFIVNFLLEKEAGYFGGLAETKPLLHLWSLGVEEQFYIFWPLMLWAAWKWKHRAGTLIALVIVASFAFNMWLSFRDTTVDFYSPLSRFWELLTGGALAWIAQNESGGGRVHSRTTSNLFSVAGMALVGIAAFALNKDLNFPGWFALLPVCGAALMIAAGETAIINRKVLAHPAMIWIGLISYPLYLWHWPLLSFAQIMKGEPPDRTVRIAMVALAFVLATLTYRFVERPMRKGGLGVLRLSLLCAAMIAIGAASLTIYFTGGLPQRFSDERFTGHALDTDRLVDTWQHKVRYSKCHLQEPKDDHHAPECIEATRPLLLLWGDSHASSLYPGLKSLQAEKTFGIAQLTQAGCPPLFDLSNLVFRKNCNTTNQNILNDAAVLQPAEILLVAAWNHRDYPMKNAEILDRLVQSVARIHQTLPQTKIIVVGPTPRWQSPLPAIYRRALTTNHAAPPMRMTDSLDPELTELDRMMRVRLAAEGIDYLSPQEQLCNASGCLTRLDDTFDSLTFIDEGHITADTATFLAHQFAPQILGGLGFIYQ